MAPSKSTSSAQSHLDKRAQERRSAKLASKGLVSGKKSLEKPKKKTMSKDGGTSSVGSKAAATQFSGIWCTTGVPPQNQNKSGGVVKPPPRKRRGLQALKRCIQMQQSTSSMVREAPFRRSLNQRMAHMEVNVLDDTPYLHGEANAKAALGFNKSVGAIAGLTTVLGKKATDLLRCAASYAAAAGRHAVTDTDVLRAAMQDEDLAAYVDGNVVLRGVLDRQGVDGERTRRLQREQPFVGVKAHIYHALKATGGDDEDEE